MCGGIVIALVVGIWIVGSIGESVKDAEYNKLSPAQKHEKELESCRSLLIRYRYKTYSELSEIQRELLATCTAQLLRPN